MKKIALIIAILGLAGTAGVTAFGIAKSNSAKTTFAQGGSVLLGEETGEEKTVPVNEGAVYGSYKGGATRFTDSDGNARIVPSESFIYYNDGSLAAFSGGVLLDFNDLSGNFINNYFVPSGMNVQKNGTEYTASTTNGTMNFGDFMWKLNDNKYIVCSPALRVAFAEDDIRDVTDFVQVFVAEDGIVRLLTPENLWTTVSEDCYVETATGVRIYPMTQRVEDENYKLSLAGISVNAEDNIVLTEDETRRQIVPEIKINAEDGLDGENGDDGKNGEMGEDGDAGVNGQAGVNGTDGSDGADGTEGASGSSGATGSSGYNGANGGSGAIGSNGTNGTNGTGGADGAAGNSGAGGAEGTGGTTGATGNGGANGEDGSRGAAGSGGTAGTAGINGLDGTKGEDGINGTQGGTGSAGRDATATSGVNSQVPAMSIGEWNVTASRVSGRILLQDPSSFLSALSEESKESFPAYVRIYDNETGELAAECYPYLENGSPDSSTNFFPYFNSENLQSSVAFGVDPQKNVLTPDTSYRMEVTAYYKADGTAYRRTFISRNFYTDSSGVQLSAGKSDLDTLVVNVSVGDSTEAEVTQAFVYLLTEEQNEKFSLTRHTQGAKDFVYRYTLTYTNNDLVGTPGDESKGGKGVAFNSKITSKAHNSLTYVPDTDTPTYGGLTANTKYIARVVASIKTANGVKETLCPQELEVYTLKNAPTWDTAITPEVNYNRVTGAFEVTRPTVRDNDQSVVSYTYVAYLWNTTTSQYDKVSTQKLGPTEEDPVCFYLTPGQDKKYAFGVEIETDDNEKTVYYDMGMTKDVVAVGSTIPSINFVEEAVTFNSMKGTVIIDLDEYQDIKVDVNNPLTLHIYGDTYYENSIKITGLDATCGVRSGHKACTVCASLTTCPHGKDECTCDWWLTKAEHSASTNTYALYLELADLYENQKYTIVLSANVRLGTEEDGFGYNTREIGNFTFHTKEVTPASATWTKVEDSGSTDALNVKLTLATENSYEMDQIRKDGQAIIQLYEGQNTQGVLLGTKHVNDNATGGELEQLLGSGLLLKGSMFGSTSLSSDKTYCLKVASISDQTWKKETCDYVNYFNTITNATTVITKVPSPPDLLQNPASAITVNYIKNSQAAEWNVTKRTDLSDDAIIGMYMSAKYSNEAHLAYKIKYYVFEYRKFYEARSSATNYDPVGNYLDDAGQVIEVGDPTLITMTQEFSMNQEDVPNVAVIFDATTTSSDETAANNIITKNQKNYCVYNVESLHTNTKGNLEGLSRGYRYIVAYTVEFISDTSTSANSIPKVYPYKHPKYSTFTQRGIGVVAGQIRFPGVYINNSGMLTVPKDDPVFHTYTESFKPVLQKDKNQRYSLDSFSIANAKLMYNYRDTDKTIAAGAKVNYTNISEEGGDISMTAAFNLLTDPDAWGSVELTASTMVNAYGSNIDHFITPEVDCVRFIPDYKAILEAYKMEEDEKTYPIGVIFCDWDWDNFVSEYNQQQGASGTDLIPSAKIDAHVDQNYIDFEYSGSGMTAALVTRAYATRIKIKDSEDHEKIRIAAIQLDGASNTYFSRLATSELSGDGMKPGNFTFEISLIFDSGDSGWYIPEDQNFGLFYVKKDDITGTPSRDGYVTRENDVDKASAAGGLFTQIGTVKIGEEDTGIADRLRLAVKNNKRVNSSWSYAVNTGASRGAFTRYMYPFDDGVDANGTGTWVGSASLSTLVPKGSAEANAYLTGSKEVEVKVLIPVINYNNYNSLSKSIAVADFTTNGMSETQKFLVSEQSDEVKAELEAGTGYSALSDTFYCIFASIHTTDAAARANVAGTEIASTCILIDANGKLWGSCVFDWSTGKIQEGSVVPVVREATTGAVTAGLPEVPGLMEEKGKPTQRALDNNTTYYLSFSVQFAGESNKRLMIDNGITETDIRAVYATRTSDKISIINMVTNYESRNLNYFNKELYLQFDLDPRAYGLHMEYEIYTREEDAQKGKSGGATPYIDLGSTLGKEITKLPLVLMDKGNIVTVDLSPKAIEEVNAKVTTGKLQNVQPGVTYWLRATALDNGNNEVGFATKSFAVKGSTFGATVGLAARDTSSITFSVNVSDKQNLLMGYYYDSEDKSCHPLEGHTSFHNRGLYAVRFTTIDDNDVETLIPTVYDDCVFSMTELKKLFKVTGLEQNKQYYINIFGVLDSDLDGLSGPLDAAGTKRNWEWFYGDIYNNKKTITTAAGEEFVGYISDNMNTLLAKLWDPTSGAKLVTTETEKIRESLLIASESRKTAPEGAIDIPANADTYVANGNFINFVLSESYGVVTYDAVSQKDKQGFAKIEWQAQDKLEGTRYTGTVLAPDDRVSDEMFEAERNDDGEMNGTFTYKMSLGDDMAVAGNTYQIIVHLYKDRTQLTPDYTYDVTEKLQ